MYYHVGECVYVPSVYSVYQLVRKNSLGLVAWWTRFVQTDNLVWYRTNGIFISIKEILLIYLTHLHDGYEGVSVIQAKSLRQFRWNITSWPVVCNSTRLTFSRVHMLTVFLCANLQDPGQLHYLAQTTRFIVQQLLYRQYPHAVEAYGQGYPNMRGALGHGRQPVQYNLFGRDVIAGTGTDACDELERGSSLVIARVREHDCAVQRQRQVVRHNAPDAPVGRRQPDREEHEGRREHIGVWTGEECNCSRAAGDVGQRRRFWRRVWEPGVQGGQDGILRLAVGDDAVDLIAAPHNRIHEPGQYIISRDLPRGARRHFRCDTPTSVLDLHCGVFRRGLTCGEVEEKDVDFPVSASVEVGEMAVCVQVIDGGVQLELGSGRPHNIGHFFTVGCNEANGKSYDTR